MPESAILASLKQIYALLPDTDAYDIGIICGSGLSNISDRIDVIKTIPYDAISGFPHSEVVGHKNELVFGTMGDKRVVCLRGRFHFYEGWSPKDTVTGVKVLAALGAKLIIVTNAAGGIDTSFQVGDVMLIDDHINFLGLAGQNPLIGLNDDTLGDRFPSVTRVYDDNIKAKFREVYAETKAQLEHTHELREGAYAGVSGPFYESRHEIEMFRTVGAQAVGMSTVNEVVQAAHCKVKVLGLSLITNNCIGTSAEDKLRGEPNHEEVVREIKAVEPFVLQLFENFVKSVDLSAYQSSPLATVYNREAAAAYKDASKCPVVQFFNKDKICNVFTSVIAGAIGAYLFKVLSNKQ